MKNTNVLFAMILASLLTFAPLSGQAKSGAKHAAKKSQVHGKKQAKHKTKTKKGVKKTAQAKKKKAKAERQVASKKPPVKKQKKQLIGRQYL